MEYKTWDKFTHPDWEIEIIGIEEDIKAYVCNIYRNCKLSNLQPYETIFVSELEISENLLIQHIT